VRHPVRAGGFYAEPGDLVLFVAREVVSRATVYRVLAENAD
jgi:hypothetical protein